MCVKSEEKWEGKRREEKKRDLTYKPKRQYITSPCKNRCVKVKCDTLRNKCEWVKNVYISRPIRIKDTSEGAIADVDT